MPEEPEAPSKIFGWLQTTLGAGLCTFGIALGSALVALAKDKLSEEAPWILAGCLAVAVILVIWTGVNTAKFYRGKLKNLEAKTKQGAPPLDSNDLLLLTVIDRDHPKRYEIGELVDLTGLPLKDVGFSLRCLSKHRLIIDPPSNKRLQYGDVNPNGYRVSDSGIQYLRSLQ